MKTKKNHRVQRKVAYLEQFDIDISKQNMGAVFEVICHRGNKYKVEVVDPKKHLVQVTSKNNGEGNDFVTEGSITTTLHKIKTNLAPYAMLPSPKKFTPAIIVEKVRLL